MKNDWCFYFSWPSSNKLGFLKIQPSQIILKHETSTKWDNPSFQLSNHGTHGHNDVDNNEDVEVEKMQPLRCMKKGLMLSIINGPPITN